MQTGNVIRRDVPQSTARSVQQPRAKLARPYSQFARSGVWRFRPAEPFRPFKPFRMD